MEYLPKIYPPELEIKKENASPSSASYLDYLMSTQNGQFTTSLYDKRDSFGFDIVNYPFVQ